MKFKNKKDTKNRLTYKLGRKLGSVINKLLSIKALRIIIAVALVIVLFVFIVPIEKNIMNIITLSLLVVLLMIYIVLKRKGMK